MHGPQDHKVQVVTEIKLSRTVHGRQSRVQASRSMTIVRVEHNDGQTYGPRLPIGPTSYESCRCFPHPRTSSYDNHDRRPNGPAAGFSVTVQKDEHPTVWSAASASPMSLKSPI